MCFTTLFIWGAEFEAPTKTFVLLLAEHKNIVDTDRWFLQSKGGGRVKAAEVTSQDRKAEELAGGGWKSNGIMEAGGRWFGVEISFYGRVTNLRTRHCRVAGDGRTMRVRDTMLHSGIWRQSWLSTCNHPSHLCLPILALLAHTTLLLPTASSLRASLLSHSDILASLRGSTKKRISLSSLALGVVTNRSQFDSCFATLYTRNVILFHLIVCYIKRKQDLYGIHDCLLTANCKRSRFMS